MLAPHTLSLSSGSVALLRCSRSCLSQVHAYYVWRAAALLRPPLATGRAAWLGIDVSKSTEVGESLVAVVTVYSRSTVAMSALASPICARKTEVRRHPQRHPGVWRPLPPPRYGAARALCRGVRATAPLVWGQPALRRPRL